MNDPIHPAIVEKAAKARYESGARRAGTGETWEMTQPLIREWETGGMEAALLAVEADIKAEALRESAVIMRSCKDPGHWNLRDPHDPETSYSPDVWLEKRADQIAGDDQ